MKYIFRLHYQKDHRILETDSLSMEIFDAPNGEKTYFLQCPSRQSKQLKKTKVNVFLYQDRTSIEWINAEKELIKSVKIDSRADLKYENGVIKIWIHVIER